MVTLTVVMDTLATVANRLRAPGCGAVVATGLAGERDGHRLSSLDYRVAAS